VSAVDEKCIPPPFDNIVPMFLFFFFYYSFSFYLNIMRFIDKTEAEVRKSCVLILFRIKIIVETEVLSYVLVVVHGVC
jgi:hypothetical protein